MNTDMDAYFKMIGVIHLHAELGEYLPREVYDEAWELGIDDIVINQIYNQYKE